MNPRHVADAVFEALAGTLISAECDGEESHSISVLARVVHWNWLISGAQARV